MNSKTDILGIAVIYNINMLDSACLQSLDAACEVSGKSLDIFLYDNSPEAQTVKKFNHLNITYFHDFSNPGVSKAYNTGALEAKQRGKEWILLLDQDTRFSPDILVKFGEAVNKYPEINIFGPVVKSMDGKNYYSPFKILLKTGIPLKELVPGNYSLSKYAAINSGLLIRLKIFEQAGGYNEKVKLDFSDIQFFERARKVTGSIQIADTVAFQDFSNTETDVEKLDRRFYQFCKSAIHYDRKNIGDDLLFLFIVLKRAAILALRTRRLLFFKTLVTAYNKN